MSGNMHIQTRGERVKVGDLEVALAKPEHRLGLLVDLGSGFAWFREGEYQGYHILPSGVANLPIAEVVKSKEFQDIYQEIISRRDKKSV